MSDRRQGPSLDVLTATVQLGGYDFDFRLHSRPLELGPGLAIRYYWMDSSQFRITRAQRTAAEPDNFRACVAHWWRVMQISGYAGDPDQIRHLVLATTYGLVGADKGLQHVYRDAHLGSKATAPEERSLPDEVRATVRGIVQSKNPQAVGEELDRMLGAWMIPTGQERAVRQTIDGILECGVELVRTKGDAGLEQFLGKFDAWCAKTRRKGGQDCRRLMLDGISYLAKCSYSLCYTNAWISLIPWLQQNRGLDTVSERFLRFWHFQNQPVEFPDGTVVPDVFRGQVLSLHPLSGFFMMDPGLCAVAGQFFGSAAYERVVEQGQNDCREYWDLVGAILAAAHLYRQALDEQELRRGVYDRPLLEGNDATPPSDRTPAGLLEEYAAARGLRCPDCGGAVRLLEHQIDPADDGVCRVGFRCEGCDRDLTHSISEEDLRSWLGSC